MKVDLFFSFHTNFENASNEKGRKEKNNIIKQILTLRAPRWAYWQKFWKETSIEQTLTSFLLPSGYHPTSHKNYERYPRISLPLPDPPHISLFVSLEKRRSVRKFADDDVTLEELSILLKYSLGISDQEVAPNVLRHYYPSAGARYPLEGYWISLKTNFQKGVFYYDPLDHALVQVLPSNYINLKTLLPQAIIGAEEFINTASGFLVITALPWRTMAKYGKRGVRHIITESGHIAQNLYLISTAIGLGICELGGYTDELLSEILDIDTLVEIPIGAFVIGKVAQS